jgi:hypothetical protein
VAAERELRLDSLLERREPDLLEALDRRAGERLVGEIGERRTAPEAERLPQQLGRACRFAVGGSFRSVGRQPLEERQIELLGREADRVTGRARLDR